jgi:hypothetical protein
MRFYTQQHKHYCGIDLHARMMYLCVLDGTGAVLLSRNIECSPKAFLAAVRSFRDDLVVAVECMFTWYWLADLCQREGIAFVLGHALYMRAIHGGKAKNDRIDAHKIAALLRGGMIPQAYVYPPEMRATRDLLRRRNHLTHKRSELIAHIQNTVSQYNLPALEASPRQALRPRGAARALSRSTGAKLHRIGSGDDRAVRRAVTQARAPHPRLRQAA